jgi:iron complex outermembrane recepter protein
MMKPLSKAIMQSLASAALLSVLAPISLAMAQSGGDADTEAKTLDQIQVIGSRRANSSSDTDTLVPVDIIPITKSAEQGGQFDLAQTLQYVSPSFNSTRQTGADGADLVDSAALRGLGSDLSTDEWQTLSHHGAGEFIWCA